MTHSGRDCFCRLEKKSDLRIVEAERIWKERVEVVRWGSQGRGCGRERTCPRRRVTTSMTSSVVAMPSAGARRETGARTSRPPSLSSLEKVRKTARGAIVSTNIPCFDSTERRTRPLLHKCVERLQVLESVELQLLEVSLVEYETEVSAQVMDSFLNVLLLGLKVLFLRRACCKIDIAPRQSQLVPQHDYRVSVRTSGFLDAVSEVDAFSSLVNGRVDSLQGESAFFSSSYSTSISRFRGSAYLLDFESVSDDSEQVVDDLPAHGVRPRTLSLRGRSGDLGT